MLDGSGATLATGTMSPVAVASYLQGTGKLSDPCNGLFTLRLSTVSSTQDVFCTFLNGTVLFSSFKCPLPLDPGNAYEYFYGCGLK